MEQSHMKKSYIFAENMKFSGASADLKQPASITWLMGNRTSMGDLTFDNRSFMTILLFSLF